jgi:hypothetical protein
MRGLLVPLVVITLGLAGCGGAHEVSSEQAAGVSAQDRAKIESNVRQFMSSVEQDVTREGPAAWAREFSSEPTFFMASDGVLAFSSGTAAAQAIPSLRQAIKKIELHWGDDLRVDVLTPEFAVVGASWRETRTMQGSEVTEVKEQGYFTGVVQQQNGKWQFRDAHWSTQKAEETGSKRN